MPELPEVETVKRALAPEMEGYVFEGVKCNRKNLRFDFPKQFAKRLTGSKVSGLARRGKYMLADLSSNETLVMHLGMSGRFSVLRPHYSNKPGDFHHDSETNPKHDHVLMDMSNGVRVVYNDPRRFGFMDLVKTDELEICRHFKGMGPEPLSNGFNDQALIDAFSGRSAPVKQALLDQRHVAGLGNIYVCEALFRAGISPSRKAGNISAPRISRLVREIRLVLEEAIEAGGSSLKDFASSDGSPGYFQHDFRIYGREGEDCRGCNRTIKRITQGGRSTFYCGTCQR